MFNSTIGRLFLFFFKMGGWQIAFCAGESATLTFATYFAF